MKIKTQIEQKTIIVDLFLETGELFLSFIKFENDSCFMLTKNTRNSVSIKQSGTSVIYEKGSFVGIEKNFDEVTITFSKENK